MVRFQEVQDGSAADLGALIATYDNVDMYITSVQDYLPAILLDEAIEPTAQARHAAVMRQLQPRVPALLHGGELHAQLEACMMLPIGCDSLDVLIKNGLRETTVTEIAGETCSGKTQLCHLAVALSAQRGERSVYFDTTNSFSAARVRQLTDVADNEVARAVLDNITVVRLHSIHALLSSLDELIHNAHVVRPKLLVIDSISALLSPIIGAAQHTQDHVLVAETARLLRHTAEALKCVVLVTNHVVGGGSSAIGRDEQAGGVTGGGGAGGSRAGPGGAVYGYKPALGEQWRGAAHVRLQLSRAGGDLVAVTVLTHPLVVSAL